MSRGNTTAAGRESAERDVGRHPAAEHELAQGTRSERERELGRLAASQHGVFSRAQADARGFSKEVIARRVRRGMWEQPHPGVYRLTGAPNSWRASLMAACLAWGPGTVASHRAAAALWEFTGFPPRRIELSIPRKRERPLPHLVHRPVALPATDVTTLDSIPVTTPERTLLDLAGVASSERVEEALDDALRRRLVSVPRLTQLLRRSAVPGRPGVAAFRSLLEQQTSVVPESVFERRLMRALKRAKCPQPVPQHEVRSNGRLIARVDLAYPSKQLAIEAEGFEWHSIRSDVERDARRQSALAAQGWRVIRLTWTELHDRPDEVVATIRAALADGDRSAPRPS